MVWQSNSSTKLSRTAPMQGRQHKLNKNKVQNQLLSKFSDPCTLRSSISCSVLGNERWRENAVEQDREMKLQKTMFHYCLLTDWETQQHYLVQVAYSNSYKETREIWLPFKKHNSSLKFGNTKYVRRRAKVNHTYFFVTTAKVPKMQTLSTMSGRYEPFENLIENFFKVV